MGNDWSNMYSAPTTIPDANVNTHDGSHDEETTTPKIKHLVTECCNELLLTPDFGNMLEICDRVNNDTSEGQEVVKAIYKYLDSNKPKAQFLALELLQSCVKNTGKHFLGHVAHHKMLKILRDHATGEKNVGFMSIFQDDDFDTERHKRDVKELACVLIKSWAEAFRDTPAFMSVFVELQQEGVHFPQLLAKDTNYDTPPPMIPTEIDPLPRATPTHSAGLRTARAQAELLIEIVGTIEPGTDTSELDFVQEIASSVRAAQIAIHESAERVEDEAELMEVIATIEVIDIALQSLEALAEAAQDTPRAAEQSAEHPMIDLLMSSPPSATTDNSQQQPPVQQELDLLDLLDLGPQPSTQQHQLASVGVPPVPQDAPQAAPQAQQNCAQQAGAPQSNALSRSDSVDAFFMGLA